MDPLQRDRLVGVVLMAIAGIWSVIVYQTVPAGQDDGAIGPRAFPLFLGLILLGLSTAMFLRTFLSVREEDETAQSEAFTRPASGREIWLAGGVFVLIILYAFLMDKVGFLLSTPIVIVAALGVTLGLRRPVLIGVLAIGITASCWLIFGKLLGVYLPHGSWVSFG